MMAELGFFDRQETVDQYIDMVDGYDGTELIEILNDHLAPGSSVLELGMGPGKDLDILRDSGYSVTGSDSSSVFLDLYRIQNPDADIALLDAVTIDTDRIFDCLYSNKVLHHLTRDDMRTSFRRQRDVVADGGLLFHSFWYGDSEEEHHGLRFVYYREPELESAVGEGLEIVAMDTYREMEDDDSIYVLLRKSP